eukprot:SAG11_NODE_6479_length_1305_cov_1.291874_2_plen_146_part_01
MLKAAVGSREVTPLCVVADPCVQLRGQYREVNAERAQANPWDANEEQLAALLGIPRLCEAAVRLIQGPPGCGKTKLIADFLSERIPFDASALATSTSRQAIDNLCEKLESVAPELHPVVLGSRHRFLDPDSVEKKEPPLVQYKWLF